MKLYVFYFSRVTKEVVRDEVEVEDARRILFTVLRGIEVLKGGYR